ncbi:19884_t:CDS:2, partial [Racocetra persica]
MTVRSQEKVFDLTINRGTFAPDGFKRDMFLINGQFPGPLISATKGDTLVLNIKNDLDEDTSIHSHGMFQRGTPWYDGVPGQGIPAGKSFTYKYQVCQSGTFWYHSHSKVQYAEGIIGPLVVYDPDDPYINNYDDEIVVQLHDWFHTDAKILLAKLLTPESRGFGPIPDSGLINGKNSFNCLSAPPGIEVEGMVIKPYKVNRLPINVAQRYSVIVKADKSVDSYWMRAEIETQCFPIQNPILDPMVKAIATYEGSSKQTPVSTAWNDKVTDCVDLDPNKLEPYYSQHVPDADTTINLFVNFRRDEKNITMGFINNSTYVSDLKYPTIYKVLDGVTQFALTDNVFLIEQIQV